MNDFTNYKAEIVPATTVDSDTKRQRVKRTEREFICWDGEGITPPDAIRQEYALFGNSRGDYIKGESLSTFECLAFLMQCARKYPDALHVGFAFNYDVNMILRDLKPHQFERLATEGFVRVGQYRIEHVPSKWLRISEIDPTGKMTSIKIADVFGFFQSSFLKALRSYIPDSPLMAELNVIESGKAGRASFTMAEFDTVFKYWHLEIRLFLELVNKLRELLYSVDLFIGQWHGPGALANHVYTKNKIALHKDDTRYEVRDAARYAYAGGRFELFRMGRHTGPVYGMDINSAYPAAISRLPSLTEGKWIHVKNPTEIKEFGVYHIRLKHFGERTKPSPLFHRDPRHNISFPWNVEGWYWSPEVVSMLGAPGFDIVEGWEYVGWKTRPFGFVADMFAQRREMKAAKIGSEKALKLALNSLYGKMAQRAGWQHTGSAPKWHQLSWAGYVTSSTRAKLFSVLSRIPANDLIGVETDGIYTTYNPELLGMEHSAELGQWDITTLDEMMYAQSGVYFYRKDNEWVGKYRGLDAGSLTADSMAEYLSTLEPGESWPPIIGPTTRFIGYRTALMRQKLGDGELLKLHRVWEKTEKEIRTGAVGKRVHIPENCPACRSGHSAYDAPHQLSINSLSILHPMSTMHDIPWEDTLTKADWREMEEWNKDAIYVG